MEIPRLKDKLTSQLKDELTSQLKDELTSQIEQTVRDKLKNELRHEIRREFEELSQQHTPLQEGVVLPTRGKASTKGSCAAEDEEEEDTLAVDTSYRCKLFAGDPPRLLAIGRVFATSSTLHTVPLGDNFYRVVVEEVIKKMLRCQCPRQRFD